MTFGAGIPALNFYPALLAVIMLLGACQPENKPRNPASFEGFQPPEHFPLPVYQFEQNPPTKEGFELGRKLFYDPLLSENGKVSCSSCHQQAAGFSDPGKDFSTGIEGKLSQRNAPALANLAWFPGFMWDGGINHIEIMPLAPLTDSLEMGTNLADVIRRLQAHDQYPALFEKAFGDNRVSSQKMLFALAQFMALMISDNSRFDQHQRGEIAFTKAELRGYRIFKQNCGSCHGGPLQTDFSYRNNGLSGKDQGRYLITQSENDIGRFKVPSLRNVALSPPYMHDGRFESLEKVIDHYTSNIQTNKNIDNRLAEKITLSYDQKQELLAFLKTLTDYNYVSDKNFSNPNKK